MEIKAGGLQLYCLLRKVGKQKTSIKEGWGTNDVRAAVGRSDKCSFLQRQTPTMSNDITSVCASHNLSQHFQLGPGKLYCRLIKILEVGGLPIQKEVAPGMKPIVVVVVVVVASCKENKCRVNLYLDYYHHKEGKWSQLILYFSNDA